MSDKNNRENLMGHNGLMLVPKRLKDLMDKKFVKLL